MIRAFKKTHIFLTISKHKPIPIKINHNFMFTIYFSCENHLRYDLIYLCLILYYEKALHYIWM
jgi:hypothetical protein